MQLNICIPTESSLPLVSIYLPDHEHRGNARFIETFCSRFLQLLDEN